MITQDQRKWLDHLSNDSKIKIVPFDSTSQEKFEKIKLKIQARLGSSITVEHHGASSLGISGQDEIDVYVAVLSTFFENSLSLLTKLFNKPKSLYPLVRARFVASEAGKHVEVHLINKEHAVWLNCLKFENYLRKNPEALKEYAQLKEACDGFGTKDYYKNKLEFINRII